MSIVMAMLEWPSRSCTIFGWTFSANIWEAWLCRIPCNRTAWPRDFRKSEIAWVRVLGVGSAVRLGDDAGIVVGPYADPQ